MTNNRKLINQAISNINLLTFEEIEKVIQEIDKEELEN